MRELVDAGVIAEIEAGDLGDPLELVLRAGQIVPGRSGLRPAVLRQVLGLGRGRVRRLLPRVDRDDGDVEVLAGLELDLAQRLDEVRAHQPAEVRDNGNSRGRGSRGGVRNIRPKATGRPRAVAQLRIERQLRAEVLNETELREVARCYGRPRIAEGCPGEQKENEQHQALHFPCPFQSGIPCCATRRIASSIGTWAMPCFRSTQP